MEQNGTLLSLCLSLSSFLRQPLLYLVNEMKCQTETEVAPRRQIRCSGFHENDEEPLENCHIHFTVSSLFTLPPTKISGVGINVFPTT